MSNKYPEYKSFNLSAINSEILESLEQGEDF